MIPTTSLKLTKKDVDYFKSVLTPSSVVEDAEDLEHFNRDWMRKYRGQSKLVLKPSSTEQVSKILAYCNKQRYCAHLIFRDDGSVVVKSDDDLCPMIPHAISVHLDLLSCLREATLDLLVRYGNCR
jgi:hypothetical protein